jgi:large subunit ribosomal protein L32e
MEFILQIKQEKRSKMADLQKIKKEKKSDNPNFIRQDHHKKKRLAKIWRRPRGCDSKKRLMKNNRVKVKPGYGTPSVLRDLDENGKEVIMIRSLKEIEFLNSKSQVVIVSRKIGLKNKILVIEKLVSLKIKILNIKDPKKYLDEQKAKKLAKKKKAKAKPKEDKKSDDKKKEEKISIEDKLSQDDKKKLEKKEIDKLLTKKQ